MGREINDISFEPGGPVYVSFLDTTDIRCEGRVAVRQTVRIEGAEYDEPVERVREAIRALLRDALGDWSESEPFDLTPLIEEAQERPLPADPEVELDEDELDSGDAARWEAIQNDRRYVEEPEIDEPRSGIPTE